jgi:23S rRNA pseudouridine1911/1915/1917 synthase
LNITFCVVRTTERLDRFLADQLAVSRTQAGRLIADKRVTARGKALRASAILDPGTEVTVEIPDDAPPRSYTPSHASLNFVYEDEHLAVLDKPAGLVVHPGPGHWNDTLVNVLTERGTELAAQGGEGRPGIVHRLDRDTSGLLVVAKSDLAHRKLATAMERRHVKRVYAALVWGHLRKSSVDIEAPIARNPKDRKKMTVAEGGRHAVTHATLVARFAHTDLLRVRLGTGRTHQIRVHLSHVGCPIVGDREYTFGGSRRVTPSARVEAERLEALAPRQLLHAASLSFAHPVTGEPLTLTSEWPQDLRPALAEAAGDANLLAQLKPLQYLGFFASDE